MEQEEKYEQYIPVILFSMLCKVIESMDEILNCDHPNESDSAILFLGTVYYTLQGEFSLFSRWIKSGSTVTNQMKATQCAARFSIFYKKIYENFFPFFELGQNFLVAFFLASPDCLDFHAQSWNKKI